MINVSNDFRSRMLESRDFRCNAEMTLANGDSLTLGDSEFTVGGNTYTDAAGTSSLPLGEAISRSITIELLNNDEQYEDVDFFGATIKLSLTYVISDSKTETISLGRFTVTEPETYGETVTISARDEMWRADVPYTTQLPFPATLGNMFRDICTTCGIAYATSNFAHASYIVDAMPDGDYTCREMLGYIAMLAGGNARINRAGQCEILTYDFSENAPAHELREWVNLNADTNDITITGVQTTVKDGQDERTYISGTSGYVLTLDNPLFAGHEQTAVDLIGERIVGAQLRKFEGDTPAYPLAEFMDTARITDRKGRTYRSIITDINFAFYGMTTLSCSLKSAVRNSSRYSSLASDAVVEARKLVAGERTARETAIQELAGRLSDASGLYITVEPQPDRSSIYYMHNRPLLAESNIVWKLTAEAFAISTDGGQSYPYGFTVTGEMITRLLYAEGINADYIDTGSITVRDDGGNVIMSINVGDRTVYLDGAYIKDGSVTAAELAADAVTAAKISSGAVTAEKIAAGAVTAEKISVSDLSALKAKIGGWSITETRIEQDHTADGGYRCGMQCLGYDAPNGSVFFAGCSTPSGGSIVSASKFYVTQNGYLYAQNAHIEGHITATSGSISGDLIVNGTIEAGKIASGAITGEKIAPEAITTDKIKAGTITSDKIQARTLQGYIIGGSYAVGNTITILNNLGLCIVCPGVIYPSVAGACKAWIIGFLGDGGLQALQAYYQSSTNSFTVLSGTSKTLAAWSNTSSGSSNQGGGGSGFSPVPFT